MHTRPIALALLAAVLLSSCRGVPAPLQLMFHPAQQVRHAGSDVASAYYRLGRYHQDKGDLGQALTAYTYASARDPKAPEPRIAAAVIHAQQGRLAQAKAMLLAVCAEYPALAQPLNNLGYVYYLEGDYGAAAQAFRTVLAREPGSERARNNLRLAEGAGLRGGAALATVAPPAAQAAPSAAAVAAADATLAPVAVPATPAATGAMQLVQTAPNVYELRTAPRIAAARDVEPLETALQAVGPRVRAQLEIANGHGAAGLAKRFQSALAAHGIVASRLTNARPFGQPVTWIEYGPGQEPAARGLQAVLGGKGQLRPAHRLGAPVTMRLLLGQDASPALAQALLSAPTPPQLASASPVSTNELP